MRQVSKMDLVVVAVLGLVLFALAITLVNVQYRARTLFVEHERAVDVGRRLADDEAHLLLKVRKASLPGSIADGAGALGLEVARGENTVNLVVDEHHRARLRPTRPQLRLRRPMARRGPPRAPEEAVHEAVASRMD